MATTEERLAELEAKMAALTTPPDDYYTSRYSGEEIDNGIDRAKSGGDIDKAIQAKANPNLLDNWYFANPVNQRGQTEYTGAGYGIDRWRLTGGGTVAVVDDGLTLTSPTQWNGLWQYGENFANFKGTKLTLSFLVKSIENPGEFYATIRVSDTLAKSVTINNAGLATATLDVTEEPTMLRVALCANVANAGSITVFAAKLELGTQQTLAHQDENGNWVLNEIPDYGEQLRRCQRYQRKIFISMLNAMHVWNQMIQFSLNDVLNGMRATPALTLFGKQMDTATPSTDGFMAVIPGGNGDSGWTISAGTTYSLMVKNNSIIIKAIIPESKFTVTSNSGLNYALHCGEGVYIFADANL